MRNQEILHFIKPICSRCGSHSETLCHALLDCQDNRDLWLSHPGSCCWCYSKCASSFFCGVLLMDSFSLEYGYSHFYICFIMGWINRLWKINIVILFNFRLRLWRWFRIMSYAHKVFEVRLPNVLSPKKKWQSPSEGWPGWRWISMRTWDQVFIVGLVLWLGMSVESCYGVELALRLGYEKIFLG